MLRAWLIIVVLGSPAVAVRADEPLSFSRDIQPILSDNCFGCHGPDEHSRKGELRLDTRDGALAALSPGKPAESELLNRITSTDPDLVMPPAKSKKPLTAEQIDKLRRWIAADAPWGKHWSFEVPIRPTVPELAGHPVDAFVRARLAKEGLQPSPRAAKEKLLRRLSFDLTGLPPSTEEIAAFVADDSSEDWERQVDRLLASEHFGERMAMWWLDAARYADTDGFQGDATRTNWPWRDWVVDAFNRNQPFDQFTIEQFAGDLLPDATPEQQLATAFHRHHMTNGEGGRDPEESRIDYVIDRVSTTGTVWLGLTLGCCQCHSHKFDPVSQAEFYSLFAFFNSIDEDGKASTAAKPYLAYQSPRAQRAVAEAQWLLDERSPREAAAKLAAESPFAEWLQHRATESQGGHQSWSVLKASHLETSEGTQLQQTDDGSVIAGGPNPVQDDYRFVTTPKLPRITGLRLEVLPDPSFTERGYSRGKTGHFILTDVKLQVRRRSSSQIRDILLSNAVADVQGDPKKLEGYGEVRHVLDDDPRNGWTTQGEEGFHPHTVVFALAEPLVLAQDEEVVFELRQRSTRGDANIGRFRLAACSEAGPAVRSVETTPLEQLAAALIAEPDLSKLDEKLRQRLFDEFLADHEPYLVERASLERAQAQLKEVQQAAGKINVMVLSERKEPRETHVLVRGVWDKKGDIVEQGVPAAIAPWPADEGRTRLGLAKWLVARDNPLTARVVVNQLWQLAFGAGLVRTPEDFGLQGEAPTHPELLDWLAVEFMESGWNVKHVLKLIVTSETYRQQSDVSQALLAGDPENRLLARGARFRLPAWMIRDAGLKASGLLNPALGGPSVRPWQPDGVWEEMFMGRFHYEPSEGAAQYRRTLYAFWRRAVGPTFLFDSAQRRVCEVRTNRTNTPLQALTLLNDVNSLEAARALADRVQTIADTSERLRDLFRRILSRSPDDRELQVLIREHERALAYYREHPTEAVQFLTVGQSAPVAEPAAPGTAAAMVAASLILNLDETITHE